MNYKLLSFAFGLLIMISPLVSADSGKQAETSVSVETMKNNPDGIDFTATVQGYLKTISKPCTEFSGSFDGCTKDKREYTLALLILTSADNTFREFMKTHNIDNNPKIIRLGCLNKDQIYYLSVADKFGIMFNLQVKGNKKLLKSSKESPVWIRIKKYTWTMGIDTPQCFSYFQNINILGK